MSDREKREAFVTLATNDTYSLGCLVLGCSLRRVNTSRQLVVMVTTDVSNPMRTLLDQVLMVYDVMKCWFVLDLVGNPKYLESRSPELKYRSQLAQVFDHIQEVDLLDSKDPKNLSLLGRPDLNVTFTKLHCWRLTQFDKAVFLDADTLVLQNVDELFDREELSAAPDAGWPDCFNSGVFVFRPSEETYESLLNFAMSKGSFDGGDQGLLNLYFSNWSTDDISKHLPFIYNVVSQAFYSYLPAFTQFKDRVRIVHFIGAVKPWHQPYNTSSGTVTPLPGSGHSQEFLQVWWNIFMSMVQPTLDPSLRRKRHLQPTIVITEPPKLAQTYAYIPKSNCAVVKHKTVINPPVTNPPWTWSNNILGTSVYCCQSLFRAFTRCWTDTSKAKACQSKANPNQGLSNHNQRAELERTLALPTKSPPKENTDTEPKPKPSQDVAQNGPNIRESMEETISTVIPFVPPKLDKVFYETEKLIDDSVEKDTVKEDINVDKPKVVDVAVYKRAYTALEANYPEEPISNITPEHPTPSIFIEATRVVEGWEKGRRDHDSGYASRNGSCGETEIKDSTNQIKETIDKQKTEHDSETVKQKTVSETLVPKTESEKVVNEATDSDQRKDKSDSEAGLAGDLAHMSVGHYSPTRMLSDKERKLNWEKGQIDYLGQDSFDNIQKKLDETLNKDEAATPPPSISSPFSPKEPTKEAPKEVVLEPVKTVAIPQSKEVVAAPPKTVAVITPKVQATAAPKVESAPAPKPAAAPTVKTTTAAAPKVATTAAPIATPAPAPTAAPKVASTAAPKATPAPAPAAAPKGATTAAPKATPAPAPAQAPKVSAPAPKVAAPATKAAPAPAKTVAPAPAKTAAPVAPAKTVAPAAPAKTAAAPAPTKTAAPAPKVTSTAAPPKPGAAGDPKATAAAPKPATTAPGFKAFGAKK